MGKGIKDFVLDSKGHCFLCLDKICAITPHRQKSEPAPVPKYSLECLSRYLKMDIKKLCNDRKQTPSHSQANLESSKLKVGLCEECVCLNELFSENYSKLKLAEMELGSTLRRIHAKLLDTDRAGKTKHSKRSSKSGSLLKFNNGGELEILKVLRAEALQKSQNKLLDIDPSVDLCNLTRSTIRMEQPKSKATKKVATSKTGLAEPDTDIKLEPEGFLPDDDNGPFDDFTANDETMWEDSEDIKLTTEDPATANIRPGSSGVAGSSTKPGKITKKRKPRTKLVEGPMWSIIPETEKYKCHTCSMEFADRSRVQRHCESIHSKVQFECMICGKQFARRDNFNLHQKSVHGGVKYDCRVCNKSFTQSSNLRQHQRLSDCGKELGLSPALKHVCHLCGRTFTRNSDFKIHLKRLHSK